MQPIYIPNSLSTKETDWLIAYGKECGYQAAHPSYPPSYRNNQRTVSDDPALAQWLFDRLGRHLPGRIVDNDGCAWVLNGLNPRFRCCRYLPGQWFCLHRDGAHHEGPNRRSFLTFMMYLNGSDEFTGGSTRFYHSRNKADGIDFVVEPERGATIVFGHDHWHDGAPVESGVKYIMRSDVMYIREIPVAPANDFHEGYVWCVAAKADGTLVSGGRDKTVRVWDGTTCMDVWRGHSLSVTAVLAVADEVWSASRDGTIKIWRDGECRASLRAHEGTVLQLIELDGRIVSSGADGVVAWWSREGTCVNQEQLNDGWVWALARGPDGVLVTGTDPVRAITAVQGSIAKGYADGTIQIEGTKKFDGHRGPITDMVALPDGRLASAGEDDRIRIWQLTNGDHRFQELAHGDFVRSLAVLPDGRLASGSYDGSVRVWDVH